MNRIFNIIPLAYYDVSCYDGRSRDKANRCFMHILSSYREIKLSNLKLSAL